MADKNFMAECSEEMTIKDRIGGISLDGQCRITAITPSITEQTDLRTDDCGRSVFDTPIISAYEGFAEDIRKAVEERQSSVHKLKMKNRSEVIISVLPSSKKTSASRGCLVLWQDTENTQSCASESEDSKDAEFHKIGQLMKAGGDIAFEYNISKDLLTFRINGHGGDGQVKGIKTLDRLAQKSVHILEVDKEAVARLTEQISKGTQSIREEFRFMTENGRYEWFRMEAEPVTDRRGVPLGVVGVIRSIENELENMELRRKSFEVDSMTGLLNKAVFVERVNEILKDNERNKDCILAVVDIDHFREFNEKHGRLIGDSAICMIADTLKELFTAGLVGRLGGDEFLVFMENINERKFEERIGKFHDIMNALYPDSAEESKLGCIVGCAKSVGKAKNFETLFAWADYALFKAASGTGNRTFIIPAERSVPAFAHLAAKRRDTDTEEVNLSYKKENVVMFVLELLGSVSDAKIGLTMAADRVCSFLNLDDVICFENAKTVRKRFHWNRRNKKLVEDDSLPAMLEGIDGILDEMGEKFLVANGGSSDMPEEFVLGSALLIPYVNDDGSKLTLAFTDRNSKRTWETEKDVLTRLSTIFFSHLIQFLAYEKSKGETEYKANFDMVTGLPRYHHFLELSNRYLNDHRDVKCYFVYSDFVNFQYMNEIYGYTEGDTVLKAYAGCLREYVNGIYFSHITSDHFVGLIRGESEEVAVESFLKTVRKFCKTMNATYDQNNLVLVVGLSGVRDDDGGASAGIDRANMARKYGKNTADTAVILYNEDIRLRAENRKEIIANMESALAAGEFHAWVQPKVSAKTEKIVGAEALVRWIRSDGSRIFPDAFIPLFEKNGFVTKVDFCVLEQVAKYLREAIDNGEDVVPISVNFSRRHNDNPEFVERIKQTLENENIPAELIEAEITESVFMQDMSVMTENISKIRQNGIAISIDDFGSGYSSLNVLADVEADVIKLDKVFLDRKGSDEKNTTMIHCLISMMKQMGYQVIAEGVETEEQLQMLREADCDVIQGYYYAKPMPIEEFRVFLKEFNG